MSSNTDNSAPRQSDSSGSVDSTSDESSKLRSNRPYAEPIPANLRRRITARRPNLGHIVPKHARRVKGGSNKPLLQEQGTSPGLNNPSMLKISAGLAKGRRLDSPQVYLRPMMGKVREGVFSTLTSFGLYASSVAVRHLDVYAGSGSVGLESLSRGASYCMFVDLFRIVALVLKGTWLGTRACPFSVPNASNPNNDNEVDRSRRRGVRGLGAYSNSVYFHDIAFSPQ